MSTRLAWVATVRAAPFDVVKPHELAVIKRRQHVTVHRDERAPETRDEPQCPGCPERLLLPVPAQLEIGRQSLGLREVDLDQLSEVSDAQVDLPHAGSVQPEKDVLEDRPVADRHERLGQDRRVRAQPHAEAPRQDHSPHCGATGYSWPCADVGAVLSGDMAEQLVHREPARGARQTAGVRKIVIVPALNEEHSIGSVITEIRAADPELDVVVVDDGSTDRTAIVAAEHGAEVLGLPFNLGIGGAVQTGYQYARNNDFDIAIQVDGDGQHDPSEIVRLVEPILEGKADMVVGTRFAAGGGYRGTRIRRVGIHLFAAVVSLMVRARVTDTTSGFRAANRKAIRLFAADYPHDYPEVEATVLVARHGLTMVEVPVQMRVRETGNSSITALRSVYYMVKVLLALFIGLFRRYSTPLEEP